MRSFLLLVGFFAIPSLALPAQVEWRLTLEDTTNLYTDIDCADPDNCLFVGTLEASFALRVARTSDGGYSWEVTWVDSSFFGYAPSSVYFLDTNNAYITSDPGKILYSGDKGETWETVATMTDRKWRGAVTPIQFRSPEVAVVASRGDVDSVYRTFDGWKTWTQEVLPDPWDDSTTIPASIYEFDNGGMSVLWQRSRAGTPVFGARESPTGPWSYTELPDSGYRFTDFFSTSETTYFCAMWKAIRFAANVNVIFRSTDRGASWERVFYGAIGDSSIIVDDIEFKDSLNGIATFRGSVLRTSDGGDTWKEEKYSPLPGFHNAMIGDYQPGSEGIMLATRGFESSVYVAERVGGVSDRTIELGHPGIEDVSFVPVERGGGLEYRLSFSATEQGSMSVELYDVTGSRWYDAVQAVERGVNVSLITLPIHATQIGYLRLRSDEGAVTIPIRLLK